MVRSARVQMFQTQSLTREAGAIQIDRRQPRLALCPSVGTRARRADRLALPPLVCTPILSHHGDSGRRPVAEAALRPDVGKRSQL